MVTAKGMQRAADFREEALRQGLISFDPLCPGFHMDLGMGQFYVLATRDAVRRLLDLAKTFGPYSKEGNILNLGARRDSLSKEMVYWMRIYREELRVCITMRDWLEESEA